MDKKQVATDMAVDADKLMAEQVSNTVADYTALFIKRLTADGMDQNRIMYLAREYMSIVFGGMMASVQSYGEEPVVNVDNTQPAPATTQ